MTTSWPQAIIFDLDGTLVDSAPDIRRAVNAAFGPLGIAPFSLPAVKGLIGGGARAAVRRAASQSGMTLSETEETTLLDRFYEVYEAASAEGKGLYPGAHELLGDLQRQGVRLALCTNKAEHVTAVAVEALRIKSYFEAIVGARDDLPKKPDAAPLRAALAPLRVAPGHALMIGDSAADIGAAKALGCQSVAVSYGYAKGAPSELGADALVDALSEVPAAITRLRTLRLK